ncbi:phenylalanine--tRNA ligase subunit beta [Moraxella caviae]|uniref:Phenylalanine--tRNA ligase beta subunit n=1 Tax=Moraxella caviae TaxID=34060 RepID=A0A1T0A888_9GAMM|nr:phenylalanine--tRNA ligase subunit beta [Moraxella caviae]OOR91890.1 phenylalanine--tRNA ligase subunit beta [Moraxella caviae]STZ09742.1 Phenylalanine--tRNA ligase beta subunit [Moraxella caviae]VEW11219.1 Phenylalanine--tRNA ligase beta subunit [Moraxella caviae]
MKISENWLRQWANPAVSSAELGEQLTMAGLELDGMQSVAPAFSGVLTGEVLSCEQHPDADKLRVTTVSIGQGEPLQIVCGAPNVRTGLKVAVATIGAVLPENFKIKKGKLRGVESHGMLCGASELGLVDEIDGLLELPDDAPVGVDVREYLNLDAQIFDVAITPNRGDCLSVLGLAREIAAINHLPLNRPAITAPEITSARTQAVSVQAVQACPRYLAQPITDINRSIATPKWMSDALVASGVRTHNFLVDVTNFVLLELGQPLHAFDADKISGQIVVRLANQGEKFTLLNDQEVVLAGDELVIADDEGVLALAGIMGGARSAVSDDTVNIVLESAYFDPLAIAGRARRFGLHTDASQRFERGVDFELAQLAIDRAVSLIVEIAGGKAGAITAAVNADELPKRAAISLPLERIERLLGVAVPADDVVAGLNRLEITTTLENDVLTAVPPSHRFDLSIAEDIIEEVARSYGYSNIAPVLPNFAVDMRYDDTADLTHTLKQTLANAGYFEAVSFSFSDAKIETLFDDVALGAVLPLANPISSELAVMRRTLLSSLLPVVAHNLNRQQSQVRLFETGLSFVGENVANLTQTPSLAIVATGAVGDEVHGARAMDFYDLKGDVEALLPANLAASDVVFERTDVAFLHPGQSAYLSVRGERLGWFGQLHPSIAKALDLKTVWVAQFALEPLLALHRAPKSVSAPSKFPSVRRDLAFLVDESLTWQAVADAVRAAAGRFLVDVRLFDVYQGERLPAGKKSLAFAMTFQDQNATLEDDAIKAAMDKVARHLSEKFDAQLRDG